MKAKAHQKAGNANRPGLKLHWAHSDTLTLTPSTHLSEGLAQADRRQYQRVGAFQNLASQGTPQITTGSTKERKHGWMMLNDAECSELKKWPLPHDLLLKVRKGLLDLASWNLAKTYRSQHDAEVLLETPNCPRLKKTAWDRFCHQMYAWQSSSFSTKRWDWSWMMCLSDLEWCEVTFVFVTLLFSNTPQAEQGSSQREGCPVRES